MLKIIQNYFLSVPLTTTISCFFRQFFCFSRFRAKSFGKTVVRAPLPRPPKKPSVGHYFTTIIHYSKTSVFVKIETLFDGKIK